MDLNSVNITATQVAKNYFSAYVENGFIYSYSVYGERQQVGVTNDAYTALQKTAQEALDKAEKYYQRLVELGDIVPPKTSEETIAELMSMNIKICVTNWHKKELKMWFWKIVSIVMLNLMHWKDRTKLCLAY